MIGLSSLCSYAGAKEGARERLREARREMVSPATMELRSEGRREWGMEERR